MLVFRFQRGSLEESMETVVKFHIEEELIDYLSQFDWLKGTKITFKPYQKSDNRIGWKNVRLVISDGCAIGFLGEETNPEYEEHSDYVYRAIRNAKILHAKGKIK